MKLTEIKLSGFKSFAKPTNLQFNDNLTAIIGPNGSGKSNLAEAVRWVLGEQSSKQLRGNSSTDIIFTGDSVIKPGTKARVSLIFDNESGRFPIPDAQVSVTRTLSRSGQSEYLLNDDPIRLIDLQQMLAEAGIGTKSYAVISQGTVDRYLTATPLKRRELFDEATGIKSLQIKIGQTENKLKKTEQHAHELSAIIHELAPRLRVLKMQADKHREREQYAESFEQKQVLWFHHAWKNMEKKINEAQDNIRAKKELAKRKRQARQSAENSLLINFRENKSPVSQLKQELEAAKQSYIRDQEYFEQNNRQKDLLRTSIADIKNKLEEARKSLDAARRDSEENNWIKAVKDTLVRCAVLIQNIQNNQPLSKKEVVSLSSDIDQSIHLLGKKTGLSAAKNVVATIEKPLQEVARLKAILQEREQQLKNFPAVDGPSDNAIKILEEKLTAQNSPGGDSLDKARIFMENARNEEVSAEREEKAAEVALEQMEKEQLNLQTTILREKGTAFLRKIQTEPAPDIAPPPEKELYQLSQRLASLGEIDPLALKEYEEVSARYNHLTQQLQDVLTTKNNIESLKRRLQQEMTSRFNQQLEVIKNTFSEYFVRLFDGGQADLKLENDGIDIYVCPPGKKTHHINLLSGGEKALTSLALLFAILKAQQPPFLVLDEVDAALDEANADRFAEALKEKSLQTQCIIITHNRQTMGRADILYGVTMHQNSVSKIYSVNLNDHETINHSIAA